MRKTIIKCCYLLAVFIVSLFVVSTVVNQGNTDMTMEMGPATFPVVHMYVGGMEVNSLYGYKNAMECCYQRESITPLGEGRKVSIQVEKYGQTIENMAFEVRSIDGERLVENTEITVYEEKDDTISAQFNVKDLIDADTEYMLVVLLENEWGQTIRYYTRIIQTEDYFVKEKLDYVMDFHRRTFDKEAAKELTKYLESNAEGDNTTFSKVTIHSSFHQVTWGDLEVEKLTEPAVTIKEIASQTGSIELEYVVSLRNGGEEDLYNVKEFYRIRYTPDRIYLLDFERVMRHIFNEEGEVFANNKIELGIMGQDDIQMEESDGGNVLAFTDGKRVFSYNVADNKLSTLFSFYEGDYRDERACRQKHGVKILNVDEAGNVQFIVYGYMNRGRHEGETGILVYYFNGLLNTVEELLYVPGNSSYEILHAELEELAYISKSEIFFFMHDGAVYAADLTDRTCEVMVSGLREESYKVSDSNRMIVWQTGEELYSCESLVLMNLNTKEKKEIEAGNGEYIAPLGFMGEDLIYGVARTRDMIRDNTGNIIFPMYRVRIQNENGEVLKTYEEPGIYVTGSIIQDNQINLTRLRKEEESGNYTEIEDDQIVNTKIVPEGSNTIETVAIDVYEKVVQIAVKSTIDGKTVKRLTPKEVLFEGGREIALQKKEIESAKYYVYGKNGVEGIFSDEGNAINMAYDLSGTVVNEKGAYVWNRGNRSLKNQIMAIKGASITEEKNSLAICLDTMLQYEGIMRNTEYMLNRGETIVDILDENLEGARVLDLTGCSLDAILYYINKDIPVLASLNDGNAVLIIGFNELNIVLMDPLTGGTPYKKGMNDSVQMFAENGNRFITYIKD
ncbi:MAG TPA: hypothetical protein DCZ40_07945 [Lachnospiraceae bacterium]|nr:hypothetical protein [Lachnospiraceae bacterium]